MKSSLNPHAAAWSPPGPAQPRRPPGPDPFVVVLLGPPGVGKSSQGLAVAARCGFEFLSVDDTLNTLRQTDPTLDANWSPKYCASMANNVLEEHVRKVKSDGVPGLVIEYVKTPDGAVIVEETCKRHGLRVNCTLLFHLDDILALTSRVKSKEHGRRIDMNPQYLLNKIHEYMFVEKAFLSHYQHNAGFRVLDASKPRPQVTAEIIDIIQQLKGPAPIVPDPEEEPADPPPAPAMNFVPVGAPFLQFVHHKPEVMTLLSAIQNFIGLNIGRDRRFPGSGTMTLDEAGLKNICATDHRYVVSKKVSGLRFLLVHLKGDATRPRGCYLVDRAFAAFRMQPSPLGEDWGDMLLDGCLVPAEGKGIFIVFDCLYFDGVRTIPETLDSRLEYVLRRFPLETALPQQLVKAPLASCAVVCKQYLPLKDMPRLLLEVETADPGALYPSDGLIFTPKKNGYRTNFDPHLFKWKPVERCSVDFRIMENRQGGHDLLLARPVGKDLREMPFDCLDSSVELPAALVGSVVECRQLQKPDSMGMTRTTWQILCIRSDKNSPDREDVATACLQSLINATRLLMLYHQFSQPQPEVYPPPLLQSGSDPSLGRFSPTIGMPIYVGTQPPPALRASGGFPGGPAPPPRYPDGRYSPPLPLYGGGLPVRVSGPGPHGGTPSAPSLFPLHPPSPLMGGPHYSPSLGTDSPHLPPGILSVGGPPLRGPLGLAGLSPAFSQPPGPSAAFLGGDDWRDRAMEQDSAVVQYARSQSLDNGVVGAAIPKGNADLDCVVGTPIRPKPGAEDPDSPQPLTPLDQRYSVSDMAFLSLTADAKDQRRAGDWPFFQTPQLSRASYETLNLDSYEDRNMALLQLHPTGPASDTDGVSALLRELTDRAAEQGPGGAAAPSPKFTVNREPPLPTAAEFLSAAMDWLLRKFVPRPSAAKPRPFRAVDLAVGRGMALGHWDKVRCAHLLGVCRDDGELAACHAHMQAADSEMVTSFVCLDIQDASFGAEVEAKHPAMFEVAALFFALEHAFETEEKARQTIANTARLLKPGGNLLVLTTDAEAIRRRVEQQGALVTTPTYRLAFLGDPAALAEGGFGQEYALEGEAVPTAGRTFAVPKSTLTALCTSEGLDPLPQAHGMFNLEEVGALMEKTQSRKHLWRDLPLAERDLVTLWSTAVYVKRP